MQTSGRGAGLDLEGTKEIPRNGGRDNLFDCALLSTLYMFKPSC